MASFKFSYKKPDTSKTELKYKNATEAQHILSGVIEDDTVLNYVIIEDKLYMSSTGAIYELDLKDADLKTPVLKTIIQRGERPAYGSLIKQGSNKLIVAVISQPSGFAVYDLSNSSYDYEVNNEPVIPDVGIKLSGVYLLLFSSYGDVVRWSLPLTGDHKNLRREEARAKIEGFQLCTCNDENVFFIAADDSRSIKFVDVKNLKQSPKILCTVDKAERDVSPMRLLSNNKIVAFLFKGDDYMTQKIHTLLIVDLDSKNMKYEKITYGGINITEDALIYKDKDFVYIFKSGQVVQYTKLVSEIPYDIYRFTSSPKYLVVGNVTLSLASELHIYRL